MLTRHDLVDAADYRCPVCPVMSTLLKFIPTKGLLLVCKRAKAIATDKAHRGTLSEHTNALQPLPGHFF